MLSKLKAVTQEQRMLIARYIVVGLTTTFIYAVLAYFGPGLFTVSPVAAAIIAFTAAVIFQYFAHARFTFNAQTDSKSLWRFATTIFIGYLLSTGITYAGELANAPRALTVAIVTIVLPISNLIFFKFWVFTMPREAG